MASVLVRSRHLLRGQRAHVLPVPAAVRLRAVGGLQGPPARWPRRVGVRSVLLGLHHRV